MPRVKIGLTQAAFGAVLIVQLFFLVNGPALFPSYWQSQGWDTWLPIYLTLTFGAMAFSAFVAGPRGAFARGSPFGDPFGFLPLFAVLFVTGFLVAFALFQFPPFRMELNIPRGDAVPTALFTVFVVAFAEELLFRWVVLQTIAPLMGDLAAIGVSSAAWAFFHFAAYGELPLTVFFVFLIGLALGAVFLMSRKFGGIGLPWGIHAGWNLGVAGILSVAGG